MEIFKNFGLDPILLAAQIVNFLILLYLLNRFFFKRVIAFLKAREEKITAGLQASQKGEELLEKAKVHQKEILKQAREEGELFIREAKKTADVEGKKLIENAKNQAQKIIEEAKVEIEQEKEKTKRELAQATTKIAIEILQRLLTRVITVEGQRKIMNVLSRDIKTPV